MIGQTGPGLTSSSIPSLPGDSLSFDDWKTTFCCWV